MFNTIFSIFKSAGSLHNLSNVVESITDLLSYFSKEYIKDKDAKNAAIDALIEILKSHKDE